MMHRWLAKGGNTVNQLQRAFRYEGQQKITTYDNAGVGEVRLISKDGVPQHIVIQGVTFDRFGLLAAAVRAGSSDNKAAWEIMNLASCLFHPQDDSVFNSLYAAAALHITWAGDITEASLYPKFNKTIEHLSGGRARPIEVDMDQRHRPDAWVRIGEDSVPVEMKLGNFNRAALKQLRRYIGFYDSPGGIAVGKQLTTCLPENITFVSIDEIEGALLEIDGGASND